MLVVKYIVFAIVVCLTIYLLIDTTVFIVRKVKERKAKKVHKQDANKEDKTE